MKKFKTLQAYFEDWPDDKKMAHEIVWYLPERLTLDQWIRLDEEMGLAFERTGIDLEDVVGVAGPIPFDDDDAEGEDA